jgi:hypothetical protein
MHIHTWSDTCSVVGTMPTPLGMRLTNNSVFQNVHTGSRAHSDHYSMVSGLMQPGLEVKYYS